MRKKCLTCGNLYTKKVNCSLKAWELSKYCSRECVNKSLKGKKPWNTGTKGVIKAWNKGLKGICKSNSGSFKKGMKPWNKGLKKTEEQKQKLREVSRKYWDSREGIKMRKKISSSQMGKPTGRTGSKCNFWKGGKSNKYTKLKNSIEWKNWRRAIFERDNYTCQECGDSNYKGRGKTIELQPHHLKSRSEYSALQFNVDNGTTLCRDCHRKTDNYGVKAVRKNLIN